MRALAVFALLVSCVAACSTAPPCDAASCQGCCDGKNGCVSGLDSQACGRGGARCSACVGVERCLQGQCTDPGGGGGGGGGSGGAGGGGDAGTPPCAPSAPNGACPTGQTCVGGACCNGFSCGGACCDSSRECANLSGTVTCAQRCVTNSDCPSTAPCCALLWGPPVITEPPLWNYGACSPDTAGNCRCASSADCTVNPVRFVCAPTFLEWTDGLRHVSGPYVCQPDTGTLGHGCTFTSCSPATTCVRDSRGNQFCSEPCSNDGTCVYQGVACCNLDGGSGLGCGLCAAP